MNYALNSSLIRKLAFLLLHVILSISGYTQNRCYDTIQTYRYSLTGDSSIEITKASSNNSRNSLLGGRIWANGNLAVDFPAIIKARGSDQIFFAKKLLLSSPGDMLKINSFYELSNGDIAAHVILITQTPALSYRHLLVRFDAMGNILSSRFFTLGNFLENEHYAGFRKFCLGMQIPIL